MQKTVLITGCSTGLGNVTAKKFAKEGWNVIATMRKPNDSLEKEFPEQIKVAALDVTKPQTIRSRFSCPGFIFESISIYYSTVLYKCQ